MSNATTAEFERKALELLPWYVNGTLEGEERELVRSQVLASLTCRKELERLRRLQELMRHDDAEAIATDRAFESLMARIRATEEAAVSPPGRTAQLAIAASLVAAAAALGWWWAATPVTAPAPYETLTTAQPAGAAVRLRVVFAPGVAESERQAVFARHRLTAVAPPTAEGVYTLGFPDDADQAAIVAALRADPRIRLVTSPPIKRAP
ncbi:MAG TPA: hypothetical protein VJL86_06030 [Steroidobacteraceae bacterium]|nr:hypothetical protein [Steroidobacteraceae bacterium]